MNFRRLSLFGLAAVTVWAGAAEPDPLAAVVARAVADFERRTESATNELAATREKIAAEKKPLLEATRRAQERIIDLGPEIAQLETERSDAEATRHRLQSQGLTLLKNISYLNTLARDSLKGLGDGLLPGEAAQLSDPIATLSQQLDSASRSLDLAAALETEDLLLRRLRRQLGGYSVPGESLVGDGNRVAKGTFVFLGPEVFFRSDDGTAAGTVRTREGSTIPVTYPLPDWKPEKSAAFFRGEPGTIFADASGGKALRLRETTGTVFQHIDRGGPIAYVILGVGLFALGLALQKLFELRRLRVDSPEIVQRTLADLFTAAPAESARALDQLQSATRELFAVGLKHLRRPKEVLEEHLFAFTLRQRLHFERRLPLLAVIATASPLLGLLGTVMGMIKTFALITVFGTGNAAKLSSGISEVLVATELGLLVAIPALVAHGFLSHSVQKKLSLLERYAVEFTAAAGDARDAEPAAEPLAR